VHSAKNTRIVLRGQNASLVLKATTSISENLELKEEFGEEILNKLQDCTSLLDESEYY